MATSLVALPNYLANVSVASSRLCHARLAVTHNHRRAGCSLLAQFLFEEKATRYAYVATECLMLWDILLTLDEEVVFVWPAPWTVGKMMYFFIRYCPPILFVFDLYYLVAPGLAVSTCKLLFLGPGISGIILFAAIEYVLVLRIHALFRSRALLSFLTILCFVAAGTMIATTLYWFENISWLPSDENPGRPFPSCIPLCSETACHTLLVLFWVPLFVFEIVVFMINVYDTWRNRHIVCSGDRLKLSPIFYRDGLIYYFVMIAISTFNLLIWIFAPQVLYYLAASLMRSLQSLACSRLILNIRGTIDSPRAVRPSVNFESFVEFVDEQWTLATQEPSIGVLEAQTSIQFLRNDPGSFMTHDVISSSHGSRFTEQM